MTEKNDQKFSSIDGHPYRIADADAWTRSRNKRMKRRIAKQMVLAGRESNSLSNAEMTRIAFPPARRAR